MTTEIPKKRLPRQRRVSPRDRPPMRLTDRDCRIIQAVNDHRALLFDQIEALFGMSRSTAQYRLARLFHHEYLDRTFISTASRAPASNPAVYTVGKRGLRVLIDRFGYDRSQLRRPKRALLSWQLLEHLLKVNDVRIIVTQAAALSGITVETWWDETTFRAHPDYVTLTNKREQEQRKPVLPDGYFCLSTSRGKARFFLEVDLGTETLSKFAPQIKVYERYVASGQYQTRFSAKSLRVLVVTTTRKRLNSLMRVTERVGGDRKYCFATIDHITKESVLTASIWKRLGNTDLSALIALPDNTG